MLNSSRRKVLLLPILALCCALSARAQLPESFSENLDLQLPAPSGKVSDSLLVEPRLHKAAMQARNGRPMPNVRAALERESVKLDAQDRVLVEVWKDTNQAPIAGSSFTAVGGVCQRIWRGVAQGWVPLTRLTDFASRLPAGYSVHSTAEIETTETAGDGPLHTFSRGYRDHGYDGTGIKVAIIDFGFAGLGWSVANGDAPDDYLPYDMTGGPFFAIGDIDHGRWCVETLYDHAPAAQYYLFKIQSSTELGAAVDICIDEGVDIISMSLSFGLVDWHDDQGPACVAANAAAEAGILFFTSAGNYGDQHWQGWALDDDDDGWVDIDPNDEVLEMLVQPGNTAKFRCKWDKAGDTDFDLYLFTETPGDWVDVSATSQELYESVTYTNDTDDDVVVRLAIYNATGAFRELEVYGTGGTWLADQVYSSSCESPSNATHPSVVSVGAVPKHLYQTASYAPQSIIKDYSSRGLSNDGMMLPDVVAPTETSVNGGGIFTGTSCAAPNAAGTAAVLWSANPAAYTWQVRELLFLWAEDKDWYQPGPDVNYGIGGINFPLYQDCNQNGIADAFDVLNGMTDANGNWKPDICENTGYGFGLYAPSVPSLDGIISVATIDYISPVGGPPAGDTIGFSMAVEHDPAVFTGVDVSVGPDLADLNGGSGPETFIVETMTNGFTLQVSYGSDPLGGIVMLPIEGHLDVAVLNYTGQPGLGASSPPSTLEFSSQFGMPNQVDTPSGPMPANLPQVEDVVFSDLPRFTFAIDPAQASYDPADGVASLWVTASIEEDVDSSSAPTPVAGFSMAIAEDSSALEPSLVVPSPLLSNLAGGAGPEFFATTMTADEVFVDVVYGLGETLTHELGLGVIRIQYDSVPSQLIGDVDGEYVHLTFVDSAGAVRFNVVDTGGIEGDAPKQHDRWCILSSYPPAAATEFVRGDCNADASVNIGDPIALLGELFPTGGAITPTPCDDACDANDDGALNIADAISMLSALFGAETLPLPSPYPSCGADSTPSALGCADADACSR